MLIRGDCWAFDATPRCEKGLLDGVVGVMPGLGFGLAGLESDGEAAGDAGLFSEGVGDLLDAPPPNFASRLLRICHGM